jgi:hypothetical protein
VVSSTDPHCRILGFLDRSNSAIVTYLRHRGVQYIQLPVQTGSTVIHIYDNITSYLQCSAEQSQFHFEGDEAEVSWLREIMFSRS